MVVSLQSLVGLPNQIGVSEIGIPQLSPLRASSSTCTLSYDSGAHHPVSRHMEKIDKLYDVAGFEL